MSVDNEDADAPLDPAAERLRRKLVRLLVVSGGIMFLGLIAVFGAIVYKVGGYGRVTAAPGGSAFPAAGVETQIEVPAGARLVASALDGERALLTLQAADGATSLVLVDLRTGRILGEYALKAK